MIALALTIIVFAGAMWLYATWSDYLQRVGEPDESKHKKRSACFNIACPLMITAAAIALLVWGR